MEQLLYAAEVVVNGLMAGIMYSLVALGFVLIFKASGVFNFAQGVMALFAALTLVGIQQGQVPFAHLISAATGLHVETFGWSVPSLVAIILVTTLMALIRLVDELADLSIVAWMMSMLLLVAVPGSLWLWLSTSVFPSAPGTSCWTATSPCPPSRSGAGWWPRSRGRARHTPSCSWVVSAAGSHR